MQINRKEQIMNLKGKVALVTGAGTGIGRGCAVELARAGADIVINDIDRRSLFKTKAETMQRCRQCSVTTSHETMFDYDGIEIIFGHVLDSDKRIDILVTGPASTIRKPALELEPAEFLNTLNDDLISHWHLAKLVAQDMIKRKSGGRIIFISSVYGSLVREGSLPYDVSKAGLNQMTRVLAKEWAKYGILVNAIAPGFTDTPGERKLATDEEIGEVVNKLPLRRAGTPQDIGEVAVMLAMTQHITGQVITVAGGHDLVDLYDK